MTARTHHRAARESRHKQCAYGRKDMPPLENYFLSIFWLEADQRQRRANLP